jgi:hypothetical protein
MAFFIAPSSYRRYELIYAFIFGPKLAKSTNLCEIQGTHALVPCKRLDIGGGIKVVGGLLDLHFLLRHDSTYNVN